MARTHLCSVSFIRSRFHHLRPEKRFAKMNFQSFPHEYKKEALSGGHTPPAQNLRFSGQFRSCTIPTKLYTFPVHKTLHFKSAHLFDVALPDGYRKSAIRKTCKFLLHALAQNFLPFPGPFRRCRRNAYPRINRNFLRSLHLNEPVILRDQNDLVAIMPMSTAF